MTEFYVVLPILILAILFLQYRINKLEAFAKATQSNLIAALKRIDELER